MELPLVLLLDNVRSTHNVGAILRTAEAAGLVKVVLCGLTPTPIRPRDERLPHVSQRAHEAIAKTALGAEKYVAWQYAEDAALAVKDFKQHGYKVYALEQAPGSTSLFDWQPRFPAVLTLGHEVDGTSRELLKLADDVVEIPMYGHKESLNVSVAAGVALYHLRLTI